MLGLLCSVRQLCARFTTDWREYNLKPVLSDFTQIRVYFRFVNCTADTMAVATSGVFSLEFANKIATQYQSFIFYSCVKLACVPFRFDLTKVSPQNMFLLKIIYFNALKPKMKSLKSVVIVLKTLQIFISLMNFHSCDRFLS